MTFPSLLLGVLLATLYGTAFHVWRGGGAGRLLLYIIFSWVGFWGGHWLANALSISFAGYGPLQLGFATIGSVLTLIGGYWLSNVEDIKT
jgi:hypothetical protein